VAVSNGNGSGFLVIGVGNESRGDDALGLTILRRLREKLPDDVIVAEETGDGVRLMELWKGFDVVVLIDAMRSGAGPGTIHMFEAHKSPLPTTIFREEYSTHAFGIPQAIELARALNQLPPRLLVYGIEGESFNGAVHMSPAVERAAEQLVELLTLEIIHQREEHGLGN
jgi:hydrogenase maturation protease